MSILGVLFYPRLMDKLKAFFPGRLRGIGGPAGPDRNPHYSSDLIDPLNDLSLDSIQSSEVESDAESMEPRPSAIQRKRTEEREYFRKEREVFQKEVEDFRKVREDFRRERDHYYKRRERSREKREEYERRGAAALESNKKMAHEVNDLKGVIIKQSRGISALQNVMDEQHLQIKQLEETLAVKQQDIAELTEVISRSTPSVNTVTRDDAYFDGELSSLAGAIRQWAFRYFRGGPAVSHKDLPSRLQRAMAATICDYFPVPDRTVATKDIEASVTDLVVNWAFRWQLVFRILGEGRTPMLADLGGTDRERQELQAQMIGMIMKNPRFEDGLRAQIHDRTSRIYTLFSSLVKAGCSDKCEEALCSILERAAHLGFETTRQVSEFQLPQIPPGSAYRARIMEDTSDTVDEDDETGENTDNFTVQTVSFPPLLRRDLDETGTFIQRPVTVRKAAVTVKSSQ